MPALQVTKCHTTLRLLRQKGCVAQRCLATLASQITAFGPRAEARQIRKIFHRACGKPLHVNYVILSTQNRNASAGLGPTHVPPTAAVSPSFQSNLLSLRPSSKTTPSHSFLTESHARQVQPGSGTTICISRRSTVIPSVNSRWQLPRQWNRMRAWHRLRLVSHSQCSVAREHLTQVETCLP